MFPTGVGMNRRISICAVICVNVPHRRGDEPAEKIKKEIEPVCSPQAWG